MTMNTSAHVRVTTTYPVSSRLITDQRRDVRTHAATPQRTVVPAGRLSDPATMSTSPPSASWSSAPHLVVKSHVLRGRYGRLLDLHSTSTSSSSSTPTTTLRTRDPASASLAETNAWDAGRVERVDAGLSPGGGEPTGFSVRLCSAAAAQSQTQPQTGKGFLTWVATAATAATGTSLGASSLAFEAVAPWTRPAVMVELALVAAETRERVLVSVERVDVGVGAGAEAAATTALVVRPWAVQLPDLLDIPFLAIQKLALVQGGAALAIGDAHERFVWIRPPPQSPMTAPSIAGIIQSAAAQIGLSIGVTTFRSLSATTATPSTPTTNARTFRALLVAAPSPATSKAIDAAPPTGTSILLRVTPTHLIEMDAATGSTTNAFALAQLRLVSVVGSPNHALLVSFSGVIPLPPGAAPPMTGDRTYSSPQRDELAAYLLDACRRAALPVNVSPSPNAATFRWAPLHVPASMPSPPAPIPFLIAEALRHLLAVMRLPERRAADIARAAAVFNTNHDDDVNGAGRSGEAGVAGGESDRAAALALLVDFLAELVVQPSPSQRALAHTLGAIGRLSRRLRVPASLPSALEKALDVGDAVSRYFALEAVLAACRSFGTSIVAVAAALASSPTPSSSPPTTTTTDDLAHYFNRVTPVSYTHLTLPTIA